MYRKSPIYQFLKILDTRIIILLFKNPDFSMAKPSSIIYKPYIACMAKLLLFVDST